MTLHWFFIVFLGPISSDNLWWRTAVRWKNWEHLRKKLLLRLHWQPTVWCDRPALHQPEQHCTCAAVPARAAQTAQLGVCVQSAGTKAWGRGSWEQVPGNFVESHHQRRWRHFDQGHHPSAADYTQDEGRFEEVHGKVHLLQPWEAIGESCTYSFGDRLTFVLEAFGIELLWIPVDSLAECGPIVSLPGEQPASVLWEDGESHIPYDLGTAVGGRTAGVSRDSNAWGEH